MLPELERIEDLARSEWRYFPRAIKSAGSLGLFAGLLIGFPALAETQPGHATVLHARVVADYNHASNLASKLVDGRILVRVCLHGEADPAIMVLRAPLRLRVDCNERRTVALETRFGSIAIFEEGPTMIVDGRHERLEEPLAINEDEAWIPMRASFESLRATVSWSPSGQEAIAEFSSPPHVRLPTPSPIPTAQPTPSPSPTAQPTPSPSPTHPTPSPSPTATSNRPTWPPIVIAKSVFDSLWSALRFLWFKLMGAWSLMEDILKNLWAGLTAAIAAAAALIATWFKQLDQSNKRDGQIEDVAKELRGDSSPAARSAAAVVLGTMIEEENFASRPAFLRFAGALWRYSRLSVLEVLVRKWYPPSYGHVRRSTIATSSLMAALLSEEDLDVLRNVRFAVVTSVSGRCPPDIGRQTVRAVMRVREELERLLRALIDETPDAFLGSADISVNRVVMLFTANLNEARKKGRAPSENKELGSAVIVVSRRYVTVFETLEQLSSKT